MSDISKTTSPIDIDLELVLKAQQELPYTEKAFSQLMMKYESDIYRFCYRILGNEWDASDATQEAMLKVFHGLNKFEFRSTFKTWLFQISKNVCYTKYKKNKTEKERLRHDVDYETLHQETYINSTDSIKSSHNKHDAEFLLSKLKHKDRQILSLRFIGDLDYKQIALVLGISLSAAKMRLQRAIERAQALV